MRRDFRCAIMFVLALPLLAAGWALAQDAPASLQANDFVAVCGDSITEQKQYSVFIEDYLLMCQPAAALRVMQAGWGGEVAHGFLPRMERDVLALKPTVVTTCYGMNDGGYGPFDPNRGKLYGDTHKKMVAGMRQAGVRLIVIGSPGCVDSNTFRGGGEAAAVYNDTLAKLGEIGREVATEEKVVFADVHGPMMDAMAKAKAKYGPTYHLAGGDGVHPSPNGQLVMAYAFLKAMGCQGDIGTITLDLAANKAEATAGHKVLSCAGGAVALESTRYPFCFFGDPASPNATRGVIEFLPFNEDLNRLMLVVKGADAAARYNVTWGQATKEFTGADLAQGVNLAAQFLDNPFCQPFQKAEQAIRAQQNYETALTKVILHLLPTYRDLAPEENAALDRIAAKAIARDQELATASSAAVEPVPHTVKVEAVR
jgi:lysophospholipase L1-like esterase